ncbi:MAG: hypothetical protein HYT87_00290 [Nitrospirae bacterium]|nr:hypothetical protein [Nitrospirota bacterium]
MRYKWIACLCVFLAHGSWLSAWAGTAEPIFPLDQVKPGMKGVGKTVFKGTAIEEFQVEVIDVLRNYAPKRSLILAEVSGKAVDEAGVIAGMSGSPVYIEGKLVGALAYRFGAFPRRPIAGITPIQDMLDLFEGMAEPGAAEPTATPGLIRPLPPQEIQERNAPAATATGKGVFDPGGVIPIETPLAMSGFHPEILRLFRGDFERLGFYPVLAGSGSDGAGGGNLEPGSSISARLVSGDISMSASGTLTFIDKDRILAFGHPFMWGGDVNFPLAPSRVLTVVPGQALSYKITSDGETVGAWTRDQSTGIVGLLRRSAPTVKVRVTVNGGQTYHFDVVEHIVLTPALLQMTVGNLIMLSTGMSSPVTIDARGAIRIEGEEAVPVEIFRSGDFALTDVVGDVSQTIGWLLRNPYKPLRVQGIELNVQANKGDQSAVLDRIRMPRSDVRAGEKLPLEIVLRAGRKGRSELTHPFTLPADIEPGDYTLRVTDALAAERSDWTGIGEAGSTLPSILIQLRKTYDARQIYVRLERASSGVRTGGRRLENLPPSVYELLQSDRDRTEAPIVTGSVIKQESVKTAFYVRGEKELLLHVQSSLK